MKKLVLFILVIFPVLVFAQAPKKANTIIIVTSDSDDVAFKKMGRIFINEGFEMQTLDKDFYMLVTKIKNYNYGMMGAGKIGIKLTAQIDIQDEESMITVTGKVISSQISSYTDESFDSNAITIENVGGKSSISGASWRIMNEIAQKYNDGKISYFVKQ